MIVIKVKLQKKSLGLYRGKFNFLLELLYLMFHALMGRFQLELFIFITYFSPSSHSIEILKAASSKYLLNDVIAGQNDPMYKLLSTSVI